MPREGGSYTRKNATDKPTLVARTKESAPLRPAAPAPEAKPAGPAKTAEKE
ncbi:MAG: hypothetical protein AB7N54_19980 [Alphaproteobacteria bacterium]